MDFRLIRNCFILFAVAYAQTTPLFILFGIKADVVLVLAVLMAFSVHTVYESVLLAVCASLPFASGLGSIQSLLFFCAIFFSAYGMRAIVPWQPFFSAFVLVLFFTFLSYVSFDTDFIVRFAPQFALESFYNGIMLIVFYAIVSHYHVRQGRY